MWAHKNMIENHGMNEKIISLYMWIVKIRGLLLI